jgi:hypothetical protein
VRNVARDGQHCAVVAKEFWKVVPRRDSSSRTFFIAQRESARWSSVSMTTTLGRV